MKTLAERGQVELDYADEDVDVPATRADWGEGYVYRPRHFALRRMLIAHLTLSVEERDRLERDLDRLAAIDSRIP